MMESKRSGNKFVEIIELMDGVEEPNRTKFGQTFMERVFWYSAAILIISIGFLALFKKIGWDSVSYLFQHVLLIYLLYMIVLLILYLLSIFRLVMKEHRGWNSLKNRALIDYPLSELYQKALEGIDEPDLIKFKGWLESRISYDSILAATALAMTVVLPKFLEVFKAIFNNNDAAFFIKLVEWGLPWFMLLFFVIAVIMPFLVFRWRRYLFFIKNILEN